MEGLATFPLVIAPCFASTCVWADPWVASLHTLVVLGLSLCLIEALLSGYRKIPFTTYTPEFRQNLPLMCLIHLLGLLVFARLGAGLDRWILDSPRRGLFAAAAVAAIWFWNQRRLASLREIEGDLGLTFDHRSEPAVARLHLMDSE